MRKIDLFSENSVFDYVELRSGWVIKVSPYTNWQHFRFDPVTIAIVAGSAVMATSTVMQGQQAAKQGKAEKGWMDYNAQVLEAEGKAKMDAARIQEQRVSAEQKKMRGYQRAAFAKGGISIEEGTSLDVLAETYGQFSMDRALTLRTGLLEQNALNQQATMARAQGKMAQIRGKNALKASYLNAAGTMAMGIGLSGMSFGGTPSTGTALANQSSTGAAGLTSGWSTSPVYSGIVRT